jgi:hypothetical protein
MTTDTANWRFATIARASATAAEACSMRENLAIVFFSVLGMTLTALVLMLDGSGGVANALALAG